MSDIVIGLDTASSRFHYCSTRPLPDPGGGPDFDPLGYFTCATKDEATRQHELFMGAKTLFQRVDAFARDEGIARVYVFCESPIVMMKNIETTRKLCMAAGIIRCGAFECNNIWWAWVDQSTWKKQILGRGNTPPDYGKGKAKEWIRDTVRQNPAWRHEAAILDETQTPYEEWFENERDLYDAWCLRVYGSRILHDPTTEVVDAGPSV